MATCMPVASLMSVASNARRLFVVGRGEDCVDESADPLESARLAGGVEPTFHGCGLLPAAVTCSFRTPGMSASRRETTNEPRAADQPDRAAGRAGREPERDALPADSDRDSQRGARSEPRGAHPDDDAPATAGNTALGRAHRGGGRAPRARCSGSRNRSGRPSRNATSTSRGLAESGRRAGPKRCMPHRPRSCGTGRSSIRGA